MAENNQVPQGILEKISSMADVDVPYFVLELNLRGKNKDKQMELIRQIEHEISFNTEYDVKDERSDLNHNRYHLHFRRIKPNA